MHGSIISLKYIRCHSHNSTLSSQFNNSTYRWFSLWANNKFNLNKFNWSAIMASSNKNSPLVNSSSRLGNHNQWFSQSARHITLTRQTWWVTSKCRMQVHNLHNKTRFSQWIVLKIYHISNFSPNGNLAKTKSNNNNQITYVLKHKFRVRFLFKCW